MLLILYLLSSLIFLISFAYTGSGLFLSNCAGSCIGSRARFTSVVSALAAASSMLASLYFRLSDAAYSYFPASTSLSTGVRSAVSQHLRRYLQAFPFFFFGILTLHLQHSHRCASSAFCYLQHRISV